jgi:hypothetical protein
MPIATAAPRILVKAKPGVPGAQLAFGGASHDFTAVPIYQPAAGMQGVVAPSAWYALEPAMGLDAAHPWDMCHALMQDGFGITRRAAGGVRGT